MPQPTRAELAAEAYRRGLMGPQTRAQYEEAVRRRIVTDPYAAGRIHARGSGVAGAVAGTINESIPGADEAGAAISTLIGAGSNLARGRPAAVGANWRAARDYQTGQIEELRANHPNVANASTGAGYAGQAAVALASGGTSEAPAAARSISQAASSARPLVQRTVAALGRGAMTVARNGVTGATFAAGNALAGRGSLSDRTQAANDAMGPGAVIGAVVPAGASLVGTGVERLVAPTARGTARAVVRMANRASGGQLLNPHDEAQRLLVSAMRRDRFTAPEIRRALTEWQDVGGPSPAFMDIINSGGRGQNTMALFRGASMTGGGRNVAVQHSNQVASDLQDFAINRTRQLTPNDARPAPVVAQEVQGGIDAASRSPPTVQPGVGGAQMSSRLNENRDAAWQQVNAAYDAARAGNVQQAIIPRSEIPRVADNLQAAVSEYDPIRTAAVQREISRYSQGLTDVTAEDLFRSRTVLTRLASTSSDPYEASAARAARQAIDAEIDRTEPMMTGDTGAIQLWRDANALRRQFGQTYEGNDLTQRLTDRSVHGAGVTNTLAPEDVSNAVLGSNGNVFPRPNLTRDLARVRDQLGADSPEWAAFQNEAMDRILARDAGSPQFGAALAEFQQQTPELAQLLIPPGRAAQVTQAQQRIAQGVAQRQALEVGGTGTNAASDQFAVDMAGVGNNLPVAQVGYRQALVDNIARPAQGATGALNRISTSTAQGENLDTAFGPAVAMPYRAAIGNATEQVNNARFIDPNTNSGTAGRLMDSTLVDLPSVPSLSPMGILREAISKIQRGATLTDAEREAIAQLATSQAAGQSATNAVNALEASGIVAPRIKYGNPVTSVMAIRQGNQQNR